MPGSYSGTANADDLRISGDFDSYFGLEGDDTIEGTARNVMVHGNPGGR